MRILVVIPHFFRAVSKDSHNKSHQPGARKERVAALTTTVASLQQQFGPNHYGLDHYNRVAWQAAPTMSHEIDIVICTAGDDHILNDVPWLSNLVEHIQTSVEPTMLGFACHRVLAERQDRYDFYCYVEDDIGVFDPLFFRKRRIFDSRFGPYALLQPNRYETRPDGPVRKLYVDYHLRPSLTAGYQNTAEEPHLYLPFVDETVVFERTDYPSAGCFILSAEQLKIWANGKYFLDGDVSYMSPLDSAVTLSVMKTFRIYKPVLDQASFLEVRHLSPRWIQGTGVKLMARDQPFALHADRLPLNG